MQIEEKLQTKEQNFQNSRYRVGMGSTEHYTSVYYLYITKYIHQANGHQLQF